MNYVPAPKGAFLIESGPGNLKHLFVILTTRCNAGQHLIVPVSSAKEGVMHDASCLLAVGSHPFITKPSFVLYAKARQASVSLIEKWDAALQRRDDMGDPEFVRICEGLAASKFTPRFAKDYFAQNAPILGT